MQCSVEASRMLVSNSGVSMVSSLVRDTHICLLCFMLIFLHCKSFSCALLMKLIFKRDGRNHNEPVLHLYAFIIEQASKENRNGWVCFMRYSELRSISFIVFASSGEEISF